MSTNTSDRTKCYSPPEISKMMRVSITKILGDIANGSLRAINMASAGCQRPRWKILPVDLEIYLSRRSNSPIAKAPQLRRKKNEHVIDFF